MRSIGVEGKRLPMRIQFRSFAVGLALSTLIGAARADVLVTGTLDHLRIEATQAPVLEVLEALKKQFGVVYRYDARPNWTVDGTFTGSLSSIWPRLLREKNYIVRIAPDRSMTVFLSSPQGPPSAAASIPSPQGPPSAAAPMPPPARARGHEPSAKQARRRPDPGDDEAPDPPDKPPP
jgi:hypothetical protein